MWEINLAWAYSFLCSPIPSLHGTMLQYNNISLNLWSIICITCSTEKRQRFNACKSRCLVTMWPAEEVTKKRHSSKLQDIGWARKIPSCKIVCHRLVLEVKARAVSSVEKFPLTNDVFWGNPCAKEDSFKSIVLITRVKNTQVSTISSWECISNILYIALAIELVIVNQQYLSHLLSLQLCFFVLLYLGYQTGHLCPMLSSMLYPKPLWPPRS